MASRSRLIAGNLFTLLKFEGGAAWPPGGLAAGDLQEDLEVRVLRRLVERHADRRCRELPHVSAMHW